VKYTRHNDFIIALGKKIREHRKLKGLPQQKLANLSNLELSQINRIELGIVNTSVSQIASICEALEIHPKSLFDFEVVQKSQ
jgi:transcriptional regulator with XRE-family HTH domain